METFTIDTLPDKGLLELTKPRPKKKAKKEKSPEPEEIPAKKAAWADEDDEINAGERFPDAKFPKKVTSSTNYRSHLVEKFESIYGQPKWAKKDRTIHDEDEDFNLLATAGDILVEGKRLPKAELAFAKCAHLTKLPTMVNSIQFHPNNTVAFVAGVNGQIDIVHVNGEDNKKLNSVILDNFQLNQAAFTADGDEIIIGSKTTFGYFYSYEMRTGSYSRIPFLRGRTRLSLADFTLSSNGKYLGCIGGKGHFYLMSMNPKEIIASFRLNDQVHSLCFSPDSSKLFAGGDEGLIYMYDVRQTKRCIHRFVDSGAISCTSLSISPNLEYFVTGDQTGLMNAYKYEDVITSQSPTPIKSFKNLKTSISAIKFNHTSEMALISSSYSDNSVRLAHFPSCTTFSNFPIPFSNLRRINAIDISPNSGFLAVANNIGYTYLYRLNHFPDY